MKSLQDENPSKHPSIEQLLREKADRERQLSEKMADIDCLSREIEQLRHSNEELNALTRVTDKALETLDIAEKRIQGLGPYVVKTLVESAGGTIVVENLVPGDCTKGSRFIVTMPAQHGAPVLRS